MLLKTQRNQLFQELLDNELQPSDFNETMGDNWYRLETKASGKNLWFEIKSQPKSSTYTIACLPGRPRADMPSSTNESDWTNERGYGAFIDFRSWAAAVKCEVEAPDLWLEITKAVQLFEAADDPAPDKFTISELGALHGQLRMLAQLFENSELLREHQTELAALTQTATVKADIFTKKDWQNWVKGAFVSVIVSLELSEIQAQELLALVRLAFGGLFLKQ